MGEIVLILLQKLIVKTKRNIRFSYWVPQYQLKEWKMCGWRTSPILSRRPRVCDECFPEAFLRACQSWFPSN